MDQKIKTLLQEPQATGLPEKPPQKQRQEVFTDVQQVMSKVFGLPPEQIEETTKPEDIKRWDSLSLLSVLLGLERRLGRKIPFGVLLAAASVGAIVSGLMGAGQ